jgi:hypothetical protein
VPAIAVLADRRLLARALALAAALLFAVFVVVKGVPTLRHDWTWPIDARAIPSFAAASFNGWLSDSLGTANPHPTTYLIAVPIVAVMWIAGPLVALALFAAVVGYASMRAAARAASEWGAAWPAAVGIGCFALFNPWVYNQVVAGHLVMVLAYAGLLGLIGEMLGGRAASSVRLALWIVLIQAQLQFFILAMLALVAFACATRKWLPPIAGVVVAMPSIVGLIAERGSLLNIPYVAEWQTNQSVAPLPLLGLSGYFAGYADRLGVAASVAVWIVLALALIGAVVARRRIAAWIVLAAAIVFYVAILGVHGPLAAPYAWIVRNVPESGVYRELYDGAGIIAALLAVLACAAAARFRALGYAALAAGVALPIAWAVHPPSDLWVGAASYPHPIVAAPPFARVALLPAFQPLRLQTGAGDGADPDAFVHPHAVPALNEYFPTYPVDMALARYEQSGDNDALRVLGVTDVMPRPWLVSKMQSGIGLAGASLAPPAVRQGVAAARHVSGATPLVSQCVAPQIVDVGASLGPCNVFFGDMPGHGTLHLIASPSDSIDARTAWIDARLTFSEDPALAQALGGALTQSTEPWRVEPDSWLLAYVRGALLAPDGKTLAAAPGSFAWIRIPAQTSAVRCAGLCELVAQAPDPPTLPARQSQPAVRALPFRYVTPWFYVVDAGAPGLLRFNERYDSAWLAFAAGRVLRHVRMDMSVNGWFLASPGSVVLVQVTAVAQLIAEIVGVVCVLVLLKALANRPTKRVPLQ